MGRAGLTALAAALVLVPAARAEVVEAHAHAPYAVHARADQSLREALNAATPITVDGRRFHGHTQWDVHWNFWWHEDAAGRCRITRVRTRLATRLQMPELRRATPAQAIDRGIAALPAAGSCAALEERANALGRRLLAEHAARDKHYDRATGHGASQGAQLD